MIRRSPRDFSDQSFVNIWRIFFNRDVNSDSAIRSSSHGATLPGERREFLLIARNVFLSARLIAHQRRARVQPQLIAGHEKTLSPHKDTSVVLDKSTCATPLHSWSPGRLNYSQLFWVVTFIRTTTDRPTRLRLSRLTTVLLLLRYYTRLLTVFLINFTLATRLPLPLHFCNPGRLLRYTLRVLISCLAKWVCLSCHFRSLHWFYNDLD